MVRSSQCLRGKSPVFTSLHPTCFLVSGSQLLSEGLNDPLLQRGALHTQPYKQNILYLNRSCSHPASTEEDLRSAGCSSSCVRTPPKMKHLQQQPVHCCSRSPVAPGSMECFCLKLKRWAPQLPLSTGEKGTSGRIWPAKA